mmetsp:Transcript_157693/g.483256  ORF Transcript_157693/g.483256 Transcript_157693/m.483256 type:complete len:85 (+) Transcript_157693:29-283(+)
MLTLLGLSSLLLLAAAQASTVVLNDGNTIPSVGLGVGNLAHESIHAAVLEAVHQHGVRLIDTAAASQNEHIIAQALAECGRAGE